MKETAHPAPTARSIAIAGDGLDGWLTADALARALPAGEWSITVVPCGLAAREWSIAVAPCGKSEGAGPREHAARFEDSWPREGAGPRKGAGPCEDTGPCEDEGPCEDGGPCENDASCALADATLPPPPGLHFALDADEDRSVAATGGAFTAGIAFAGWSAPGAAWFHPFGTIGAQLGPVAFPHLLMRLRAQGASARLANYSLAALAAQAGRFARPADDPQSVLSTLAYGLHLDCRRLTRHLKEAALAAGVTLLEAPLATVERAADGALAALITAAGQRVEADLYIDCSGAAARLADDGAGAEWEDWSVWLPCDRLLWARSESEAAPPPYSLVEANRAGWVRHLPLAGTTVLTAAWQSAHAGDEEMRGQLERAGASLAGEAQALRPGRRKTPWQRNVLAVGSAAARLEPLAISALELLRRDVDRLLGLLPGGREARTEAAEYNRRAALLLDNARDYTLLHYRLNGRHGEAFWDACRSIPVPPTLDYKMRLYASRGRVPLYDEEPLEAESWIALFDECGVRPRRCHPIADGVPVAELEAHADKVRRLMLEALARMPAHGDYLARLGVKVQDA